MDEERQSGFLHRWSRRKIDARQGVLEEEASDSVEVVQDAEAPESVAVAVASPAQPEGLPAEPIPPTMGDVQALTSDSDFSRFVVRGVSPDVKNAALKKLFSDPHYNVMDGLDTYIDDYSQLAPLPESALRKMAVSKVFGFFEEEARCADQALTEGGQAPASEHEPEPGSDNAATPQAGGSDVSALPASADPSAAQAYTGVPEPASRAKP